MGGSTLPDQRVSPLAYVDAAEIPYFCAALIRRRPIGPWCGWQPAISSKSDFSTKRATGNLSVFIDCRAGSTAIWPYRLPSVRLRVAWAKRASSRSPGGIEASTGIQGQAEKHHQCKPRTSFNQPLPWFPPPEPGSKRPVTAGRKEAVPSVRCLASHSGFDTASWVTRATGYPRRCEATGLRRLTAMPVNLPT
jgi:hypothetical protein